MVVDARGYQLGFDPSPITNSVGGLVQQTILDRLGQQASAGDAGALSQLATRDPRAAQAIGGILMGRQEQQLAQQEAQQKALQERQKITYSIARGFKSATNKQAYLAAAAQQLDQLGQPEMAQDLQKRAELYATNPEAIEQEADAIIGMNAAPAAEAAPTNLGKLIKERDSLPQGDPRRAAYDDAIKKEGYIAPSESGKPVSVSEGAALVDPKTGRVIYRAPPGAESGGGFKQATELRKEFIAQSQEYSKQNDAIGRISASAKDPSAAGDLSLIFNYMKVLDPGSTVREGEFATAQNAGGIPDRTIAAYNKVLRGERLAPAQRVDFVNRANKIFSQAKSQHAKREAEYSRLAKQNQIDPTNVIVDFSTYQPEEESAPPIKFLGFE
jgi:hypothetical protein